MYDLGRSRRAVKAFTFDEISIVPSRRTRGIDQVNLAWKIDAVSLDYPLVAAPMDSVMSPETAIAFGQLGGLGVLNLEGLWTRYEDPTPILEELAGLEAGTEATMRMQQVYAEPIKGELIRERMRQIQDAGVPAAGALSPQNTQEFAADVLASNPDFFVIRGLAVSAEHVSDQVEPLNLKEFVHQLDVPVVVGGCANYQTALHLMRSGAAGVLVGFGGASSKANRDILGIEVPMATAIAEVAEARRDYMDESGGRYVHVIADGSMGRSGDIIKALACGADAAMVGTPLARAKEAPGRGWHWGAEAWHETLPRGRRVKIDPVGTLEEVVQGPSHVVDGTMNLVGAIRRAMATTGYTELKEFQRIELRIH
ncbi:GuaB3 family IMP dehydrogenase-related protein [Aestuariimicrobium ganziense]|uniref:GuaB3 family IMP dehydrogenase-related protein n=1 Tax=Aestuariimicrobium ganziense TaxID=2773677 RepID=UPI0019439C02|nr:GuaB3 family IMP dehydrogenase-related protein [Aestuariimicrobium ganziense]